MKQNKSFLFNSFCNWNDFILLFKKNQHHNTRSFSISLIFSSFLTSKKEGKNEGKKCSIVTKDDEKCIVSWGKMDENCIFWKPVEVIFSIKFPIIFQE